MTINYIENVVNRCFPQMSRPLVLRLSTLIEVNMIAGRKSFPFRATEMAFLRSLVKRFFLENDIDLDPNRIDMLVDDLYGMR